MAGVGVLNGCAWLPESSSLAWAAGEEAGSAGGRGREGVAKGVGQAWCLLLYKT